MHENRTSSARSTAPTVCAEPTGVRSRDLVLADDFDGPVLDTAKWTTCYRWADAQVGCTNGTTGEEQWYQPGQVSVADGKLILTADRRQVVGVDSAWRPVVHPYTSGMIVARPGLTVGYGYIEVRARVPWSPGLWPALWMLPEDGAWPPEIDIMESHGSVGLVTQTLHMTTGPAESSDFTIETPGGWHTYGLERTPTHVEWFVDGRSTKVSTSYVDARPMYFLANLAVGGVFPGPVNALTVFPSSVELDYVRIWADTY